MTRLSLFALCTVLLLLMGCGVEDGEGETIPATTPAQMTEVLAANTEVPATPLLTTTNTPTLPPPTNTPTLTPPPTETPIPHPDTPPFGNIYFFWDPTPFDKSGVPSNAPKHNLYRATAGDTLADWHVDTLLDKVMDWTMEAPSFPQVVLSSDQTKLVLTTWKDINYDGDVEDVSSIQIYDLEKDSLTRVTEYDPLGFALTGLSDGKKLVYLM